MLKLMLGRSGTGKTHVVYDQLCDLAWSGEENLLLLVPEQFSFESERTLLHKLGPRMAGRVQVLSFTRMAEQVFREVGGLAGRRMDDVTRVLLMSRALEAVADRLTLYRRSAADPAAVSTVLAMTAELKQCGVTPLELEHTASAMEDSTLRRKTQELALILGAYEALAAGVTGEAEDDRSRSTYIDPLDDLSLLARRLPDSRLAVGAHVFVDSFKGFTAPELQVLSSLMKQAQSVTVALCADTIDDKTGGYGLFSPVIRTAAKLRDMAYKDGVTVAKIRYLTQNHRAQSPALRAMEAGFLSPRPESCPLADGEVAIAACADIYAECDFVARAIRRQLRQQGGRCRDFAVVARSLDSYRGILDAALEKQGIPFVMDERADVRTEPLAALVLAALDTVTGGFQTDDILRLMKTGLCGFSTHSTALVENYALMWRINGTRWRSDWTGNPQGLSVKADDASDRQLRYLNLLRRRLVRPLERLRAAVYAPDATGVTFAKAIYRYLTDVRADTLTRLRVNTLDSTGEPALAERMARLWEVVMGLLDTMAVVCPEPAPAPRLTELFRLIAGLVDLGAVPQSLDAVQVGAADRVRFSHPKTVFILGANEGVFPAYPATGGILTDGERRELITLGLPLSDAAEGRAVEERFFAYTAVAAPSHRLVVSYLRGNAAGETLVPSVLVDSLRRVLPDIAVQNGGGAEDAESERDAFECAASLWTSPAAKAAALREVFTLREDYRPRVAALNRAAHRKPAAFTEEACAHRLFGSDMRLSASRVEAYHQCRYAYFCKYGLKAEPRRTADLDALAFGTLTHWVMEHVLPGYVQRGLDTVDRAMVLCDAAAAVRAYVEETMGGLSDKTARFAALLDRLTHIAGALLWQVVRELRQSQFVPVDYELTIGHPPEEGGPFIPPVVLTLPDGAKVRVQGQIDRVDIYRRGSEAFVRVVDYKTGSKEFRLSDVVEGINVQMLLYLFAVWQNGGERYGEVTPAGVLYLPAKLPVVQVERDADSESAETAQIRQLRMNGLLLDDPEIVRAMEADGGGLFIPARIDSKGGFARGAEVASLQQFGQLKKRMEKLLVQMAQTLRSGDIAAIPAAGQADACAWCDYRSVCGHEQDDPVRYLFRRDDKEIYEELAREDEGE